LKHKNKLSIKWKFFTYLMLFTMIILIMLWLSQVVFLETIYKSIKINEIKTSAKNIAKHIDDENIKEYADMIGEQNELCIIALKMENINRGLELVSVDKLNNCLLHNTDRRSKFFLYDLAVANDGEYIQNYRYDQMRLGFIESDGQQSGEFESIIYTLVFQNNIDEEIFLMVNSVISPVAATVRTLYYQLIVISISVIILAVILTIFFSNRISKPIRKINDSAKILATGSYNVDFKASGYKEVSELAETLNYAADELSKTDQMKTDLIANISHDLRTPLTMIVGYSELMRDIPGENIPENIQTIIDEAKRLTSLVNDVLDISKLQSGVGDFISKPVNITETIKKALLRYNKLTEQDGYTIDFEYAYDVTVNTDETRIMQALYNLINNAVTYTGADKRVTVAQTVKNGCVRISVTDTGEGIEADKLPLIWERYYKVDKIHKRASIGSGLGLSIVKSIMDMAGGNCGVESKIGWGSTFWIELPLRK